MAVAVDVIRVRKDLEVAHEVPDREGHEPEARDRHDVFATKRRAKDVS
jgi:hypothetical protein